MVDSILISILSCNPRTSDSAWEIVGAQQRCFRWKSDCLQGSSLPSQSGSPQQGVDHVLRSICQPQSPCDLWLFWVPCPASLEVVAAAPSVCAASACWLPSLCYSVSSTFPPLPLLSSWEPKPSWEQGREMSSSPFLSHSRCKGSLPQTSLFLEPETKNVLISVFFSPGWLTVSTWRPLPGALIREV